MADQLEYKKLRFELARQKSTANPWKFEHCLTSYYRAAQVNDEVKFVEVYKKGIFNDDLRKLLLLHNPALTTIPDLKAAIQRYPNLFKEWNNHTSRNKCSAAECPRRGARKKNKMVVGQL